MSMLRSVLTYMGLGPDEEYDDGYLYEADSPAEETGPAERAIDVRDHDGDPHSQRRRPDWLDPSSTTDTAPAGRRKIVAGSTGIDAETGQRGNHDFDHRESARPLRAVPPSDIDHGGDGVAVRSAPATPDPGGAVEASSSRLDAGPSHAKPRALSPQSFGDAKILADEFMSQVPVIMNLQGIERDLARRLIDFASGICYGLDGAMEKIAPQVFLLTPESVEISEEERRRIEQRGYE